jgi:hypothetical protein
MAQTVEQIEAQIDRTREALGSNFHELGRRVDAATDWREHFRANPALFIGAAFVGGLALAGMLRGSESRRRQRHANTGMTAFAANVVPTAGDQALNVWNAVKSAAVGLACARLVDYVDQLLPGFHAHYRRAEQRAGAWRDDAPSSAADFRSAVTE